MGAIAGPNTMVLMLTAMEHDLEARLSSKMDAQMMLSMQSMNFANQKASIFSQISAINPNAANYTAQYNQVYARAQQIEARERMIQAMEKTLEMQITQLQNQLKQVQQRKEAEQKRLDKNIQGAFTYGLGGGR